MKHIQPIIGITLGDPVGIGPEIILQALQNTSIYDLCRPLVIGDINILKKARACTKSDLIFNAVDTPDAGIYTKGHVDVLCCSDLNPDTLTWGCPTPSTGRAMVDFITTATRMTISGKTAAIVTCPINKTALKMAGSKFPGHTEFIADQTKSKNFVMMLAGRTLRVVLVTIHIPLKEVPRSLSTEKILSTVEITQQALKERFGIRKPRIAVAGLNPHAGEDGMFGDEEKTRIIPAIKLAREKNIDASGPFPPDTVFYNASKGDVDAVVCMYHDQGLIPFKLIHFSDGVNTTLGLPIIRTSVDHGTAYDIAGTGRADPESLVAAIQMAATQAIFRNNKQEGKEE